MIIRQAAFDGKEKHLKGGLHNHTTRSDGNLAPDELIRLYYKNGYDFVALTDHYVYNRENFAPDVPITIIPGCEGGGNVYVEHGFRTYHTVLIGKNDDSNGFSHDERVPNGNAFAPDGKITGSDDYQPYLDMIHEKGNLTIYCHPEWSCTPARCFENMKGNFAMEIWNSGCVIEDYIDRDAPCWDEILVQGKKIFGVATDDGHCEAHCCKGWVMVRAENHVDSILAALEKGAFYSSTGPKIYDFYMDGNTMHLKCDPASMIRIHSDVIPIAVRGENMTDYEIEFGQKRTYCRVTVTDAEGRMAWTNPIFFDED